MPPSLTRRWSEELRVADDGPHVLVEEVGLASEGLILKDVAEARYNRTGNSPALGS